MSLDRRANLRYSIDKTAILKVEEDKRWKDFKIKIVDLSLDGVKVNTSKEFFPSRNMVLEIKTGSKSNQVIELPVKLHHFTRLEKNQDYILNFRSLNDTQKESLTSYMNTVNAVEIDDRRKKQRRTLSSNVSDDNRNRSDRRLKYPIFLKCERMSQFKNLMQDDIYLFLREISSSCRNNIVMHGKKLLNFGSNNYLGLATHPLVVEAGIKAAEKYGIGSGGTRMLSGTMDIHNQLEEKLAEFIGGEECIIFSTGHTTNMSTISLIAEKSDYIVYDEKSHANIIDGCTLSEAHKVSYKHNNMKDLERKLKRIDEKVPKIVITDGVFSMDGDIAKLDEIYDIAEKYDAPIMLNDSHATGVIGNKGMGTASYYDLKGRIGLVIGALSKALGGIGGFAVSDKNVIHALKHFSKGFVFATSLPPLISASVLKSIEVIEKEPHWHEKLKNNYTYLKNELTYCGFDTGDTESAIIPIMIRNRHTTYKFTKMLHEKKIFVNGIEHPAVKKGESRLRVSVMATHTSSELARFVSTAKKIGKKLGII